MKKFFPFIFFSVCFSAALYSEDVEEYILSDSPYGMTFDGTNFWYIDTKRRALYKIDEAGRQEVFNLNIAKLSGISFDGREGKIFVASPRMILKVEPNTGGVTERIPVPIDKIGGIASVGTVLYILNAENGKVTIYDKATNLVSGGFFTDRSEPKDLCFGRDSLWVSDSSDGNIYRYDIITGKITGSIKSPGKDIRGLVFVGSKLWVVDKEEKKAKRINYIETDRFIASLEREFSFDVEISFSLNDPSIATGELAILLPPLTEHQRVRSVKSSDERFKQAFAVNDIRALVKNLTIGDQIGKQTVNYSFSVRTQNLRYYITDEYLNKHDRLPPDIAGYQKNPEAAKGKNEIFFVNKLYDARLYNTTFQGLFGSLSSSGFPVKPGIKLIVNNKDIKINQMGYAFIMSYGWVPINDVKLISGEGSLSFVSQENSIDLVHSPSFEPVKSPVFYRNTKSSPWQNLDATMTVKLK